jgi:phage terminase large subunit-like protein
MHSTDDTGRRWVIAKSGKRYWFDQGSADAACAFFPTYLRHTKGEWFGQPFHLTRWERRIIRKIFGWKRADGTRRYRRLWLELPRKNGKTEFAAGIALLLMVADGEPGAEIYSLASEEGQARIVFERANIMVGMSDELSAEVERFKTSLYCAALQSSFKPLTALPNSKQGFSPSGFIGDEVHVWISGDLADAVHEGEGTRAA